MATKEIKNSDAWYGISTGNQYQLAKTQRLDLVYRIAEVLSFDDTTDTLDEIRLIADEWATHLLDAEVRREWGLAGYPDPYDFDEWGADELHGKDIHDLMKLGLCLALIDWSEKLFAECDERSSALQLANDYLAAHGWNTYGTDGRIATHGTQHGE